MLNLKEQEPDEALADSVLEIGPTVPLRPVRRRGARERLRWFAAVAPREVAIVVLMAAAVVSIGLAVLEAVRSVQPSMVAW